jgi:hypothetical protein
MVNETVNINFQAGNLDAVEAKIKAIGGAINILGGSVELLVGSMGLIGIDDKVQKQFQEAATSAIAFADGAKRVFEGYKELREASQLFSKAQQIATTVTTANTVATTANNAAQTTSVGILGRVRAAWTALTAAIARNPIGAIAVALTAVIASLVAYAATTEDVAVAQKKLNDELDDTNAYLNYQALINEGLVLDAKLKGASDLQILKLQKEQTAELIKNTKAVRDDLSNRMIALTIKQKDAAAEKQRQEDLKEVSKAYDDARNQVIKYENALKSLNVQIKEYKPPKAPKKELTDFEKEIQKTRELQKKQIEDINNEIGQLAAELGYVYKASTNEIVDDTRTRTSELAELETNYWETITETFDKGSQEAQNQLEIYEKQKILIGLKYDLIDKQREADRIQREQDASKDFTDRKKKEFDDNKTFIERYYTEQDTLLLQQNLKKEEYDKKAKKLELEKLLVLKKLYQDYGQDVTEIHILIAKITASTIEKTTELAKFFGDEIGQQVGGVLSALNSVTSGMLSMAEQNSEDRLNAIEVEYNKKLQNVVGTEEEIAAQTEQLEYEKNVKMEAERKRAYDDNKKLKIADTITSGLSAAFQAFGGAMSLGPILGPIVGGVLSAMILAQMANTVSSIKKQQYTGSTPTPPSRGGGAGAAGGGGTAGGATGGTATALLGGGFNQPIPNPNDPGNQPFGSSGSPMNAPPQPMNTQPIRAYVVSSDISNGLEAEQQLQNRRRL